MIFITKSKILSFFFCLILFYFASSISATAYQIVRYPFDTNSNISANYGQYRIYRDLNNQIVYRGGHEGIDLIEAKGTPVYPIAVGKIKFISYPSIDSKVGYGRYVVIDYGDFETLYGHLNDIVRDENGRLPSLGSTVDPSKPIGYVGTTGNSTGSHLHYGLGSNIEFTSKGVV